MKRKAFKSAVLVLLALLLCVSSLSGCREQPEVTQPTVPEQKQTFVQLLGFESYEEVTGTKLAVGNMLGGMEINTDAQYITQGSGSLKLSVQGNYDEPASHPYIKLDFLNTTCATCDFSGFRSISFDVYNASDEELHIKACINVGKEDGNYIATAKESFTLKANGWTTCTYDLSMMAGFSIYDFTSVRYLTVEFMEHKQSREDAPNVFYIDNLIGSFFADGEQPQVVAYDFHEGIDFETSGSELLFTGQGKDNDAAFERASYEAYGIEAPENGGSYGLRLSHETNYWPTFRINFGKELQAGTVISFVAYARIDGQSLYDQSIFEYTDGGDATVQFKCGAWTKLSFTLKTAGSYVDLFWNFDRAQITSGKASGEVFIDNIVATDPVPPIEPEGNFWEGIDFEIPGNAGLFVGQKIEGAERNDATIERVAYSELDIPAPENGGGYALRLSHDNNYWPTFRINFGEKLPAGTVITFQAYGRITSGTNNLNQSIFEYSAGGEATDEFKCDAWTELTMELPEAAEYVDLFWNYDRAQITSETASAEVYIDNVIATPGEAPITPVGDFYQGLDFEIIGNVGYFVGQGDDDKQHAQIDWVSYDAAKIPVPENGGSHLMKLSHDSFYWPAFRMNFGKTLPAGTKITFMAYGTIQGETLYDQSIFEYTGGGEATAQFKCGQWTELTITLSKAAQYVDLFWNYDRAGIVSTASGAVYIDNMIAIEPVVAEGDFMEGVGFEVAGNAALFTAVGGDNAWRDANLERVTYSGSGIEVPANGGSYALKITCASSQWPVFRINFGKTLKAGTTITFDAYTNDTSGIRNTVSIFEYVSGGDATPEYFHGSWKTLTMTLESDCSYIDLVCNMDRWNEPGPANMEVYLDNFKAVEAAEPIEPVGDFIEGIDFETSGNEGWFGAVGGDNAWRDATLERVSFDGDYALKITCTSSQWPVLRINFGKTLKAGTVISFQAYSTDTSDPERATVSIFESIPGEAYLVYTDANGATDQYYYNSWADLTIVLAEDREYVDLVCNMDRWNEPGPANLEVYVDNFKAVEPAEEIEPTGDITKGIDFETQGNELRFTGTGSSQDATVERVSYTDANVTAPANGGEYALKVSHTSNCWPNFRVNFGKTLKAGTTVTFDVYGSYDYEAPEGVYKYMKLELTADSKSYATSADPNQVVWTLVETWNTGVTVTLTADSDHVDFFYNVADGQHGDVSSRILLDNFKAVEPVVTEAADFLTGVTFETLGHEASFTGTGAGQDATVERVSYADAGVTAPENGGEYALKVSHASNCWPTFRVSFGKTLKAGTTVTFDVYGSYDYEAPEGVYKYMKLELTADSKNIAESEDPNQVIWTLVEAWKTGVTVTLTADSDHVDFFYNVADGQHGEVPSWLLLDNFKAVEPLNITQGLDFEDSGDAKAISGTGAPQDAAVERVAYADIGVSNDNGGEYALKLSHTGSCWPTFRVNFGKTLKAGTTVTFDVYGNYDYEAPEGVYKYVKLELTADSKNYAASADSNQVVWTLVEIWNTGVTVTLTADSDHVDFFYNVADGSHGEVPSWLLLDNFKAVEPAEATGDFAEGIDFEADGDELWFGAVGGDNAWRDATLERVSFDGDYALKLTCASSQWPVFRINFGETLPAGTTVTFDAYTNDTSGIRNTVSVFEYVSGGDATDQYYHGSWNTLTMTLASDCSYIDLMCNMDRWNEPGPANMEVYLDNFLAAEPSGEQLESLDFEEEADAGFFAGQGKSGDALIERVTYAALGIAAPENGGEYALKLSHDSNYWPTFRINFGKTLPAGTQITFDAYGKIYGETLYNQSIFEYSAGGEATAQFVHDGWKKLTITLQAAADHIDLFWNYDRANIQSATASGEVYIDNVAVAEP